MSKLLLSAALGVALVAGSASGAHAGPSEAAPAMRRFALIISSNNGGADRPRLRFADSDARAMADILRDIGGLARRDLTLLPNARRASLVRSFALVRSKVERTAGDQRRELVIYYSGHSDERGLLLGGDEVPYSELRALMESVEVDVRVVILDSCASGAMIRQRGGNKRPSFLRDLSTDARGHVLLTASSADEAAQESDRIGAGFFSHYLRSALRGAADTNGDGLVTLSEAYQFAYSETLRRTARTPVTQHPGYDFQLSGQGDLVLTDLRASSARLVLGKAIGGRVFIRDSAGRLVVELSKQSVSAIELGLDPGTYELSITSGARAYRASVKLRAGRVTRLGRGQLVATSRQPAQPRGTGDEPSLARRLIGERSLLGSATEWGGYASMAFRYTRLGGADGFLAGPELALLINRRFTFSFVAAGGTSAQNPATGTRMDIGYAALAFRYQVPFDSPVSLAVGVLAGAGGLSYHGDGVEDGDGEDSFFLVQPEVAAYLAITRMFRLGLVVGHRTIAGAQAKNRSNGRGVTGGLDIQLGWF